MYVIKDPMLNCMPLNKFYFLKDYDLDVLVQTQDVSLQTIC